MALGSSRKLLSHAFFDFPSSSTSTHVSAPYRTAQMAMTIASINLWRLVRSTRGSSSFDKYSISPFEPVDSKEHLQIRDPP